MGKWRWKRRRRRIFGEIWKGGREGVWRVSVRGVGAPMPKDPTTASIIKENTSKKQ